MSESRIYDALNAVLAALGDIKVVNGYHFDVSEDNIWLGNRNPDEFTITPVLEVYRAGSSHSVVGSMLSANVEIHVLGWINTEEEYSVRDKERLIKDIVDSVEADPELGCKVNIIRVQETAVDDGLSNVEEWPSRVLVIFTANLDHELGSF